VCQEYRFCLNTVKKVNNKVCVSSVSILNRYSWHIYFIVYSPDWVQTKSIFLTHILYLSPAQRLQKISLITPKVICWHHCKKFKNSKWLTRMAVKMMAKELLPRFEDNQQKNKEQLDVFVWVSFWFMWSLLFFWPHNPKPFYR
jgi:hypothetical protein